MNKFYFILLILQFGYSQQSFQENWYSAELENIPQNSIKSIVPDKYGFIWMTTENGLLRFDGENFKIFNSDNFNLKSNRFAYISGNIQKDSLSTHTAYNVDQLLINERKIVRDKKTSEVTKDLNNIFYTYEDLLYFTNFINEVQIDIIDRKIFCENEDYYLIGEKKITLFNKKNEVIREIIYDYKKNTAYFLHDNNLILFNYKKNTYSLFENNFSITYKLDIPENSKIIYNSVVQQLFIYSENDILLLNKKKNQIYFTTVFSKPNINLNIKSLYYNVESNKLFIGTIDKGLNIISKDNFKVLTNPKNTNNNYYGSFPISENEFVTTKGEIYNETGFVTFFKNFNMDYQQSIAVDNQKNIWLPNGQLLYKYLKSTNYQTYITYEVPYKIGTIYVDSKNKIWIGMDKEAQNNAAVYTIDTNEDKSELKIIKNIKKPINFFLENSKNEMLMVSEDYLLTYNLTSKKLTSIPTGKNFIRSLFISKDNTIWACTFENGFSLLENNTLYKMPFDNKMYLLSAHCIKEDNQGHFWISTNKGLIEVTKESLLKYHKNKTPIYYHHYNIKNGFLASEFNGGCQPCAIEINKNYIFPSLNGMVIFNPEKIKKRSASNDFYLNEVEFDGNTHYFKDTLYIKRNVNRVKFIIDYPYFGNQDNVSFDVKLELSENDKWIKLENKNEISYTNLPPGTHTLWVRKIKPFSSEYVIKKITIEVPYYFYEQIWFKLLLLLLVLILIIFTIKLRLKFIRKKNIALEKTIKKRTSDLHKTVNSLKVTRNNLKIEIQQQKKLIGTISHDIKSPLKFLSITSKHLYEKSLFSENEKIKENAKVMQESASELYRFVENLVDYSKVFIEHNEIDNQVKKENIDTIIYQKINLFKNLASENKITITYKNSAQQQIFLNTKIIGIIIHNLLDNAIKNTSSGNIVILTSLLKNKIYISVEDTGNGMHNEIQKYYMNIQKNSEIDKLAIQNYGLGLHMVLELLRILKGEMKINSVLGEGTKVTLIIDNI